MNLNCRMNNILYDLRPGLYDVDVRVDEACTETEKFIHRYTVEAKDEKVMNAMLCIYIAKTSPQLL